MIIHKVPEEEGHDDISSMLGIVAAVRKGEAIAAAVAVVVVVVVMLLLLLLLVVVVVVVMVVVVAALYLVCRLAYQWQYVSTIVRVVPPAWVACMAPLHLEGVVVVVLLPPGEHQRPFEGGWGVLDQGECWEG